MGVQSPFVETVGPLSGSQRGFLHACTTFVAERVTAAAEGTTVAALAGG